MKRAVYVVLLHSPMEDRNGREVTTAVTNLDIHDIARTCRTYGVEKYFIVNPEEEQERVVRAILDHWREEISKVYHPSRAQALSIVRYCRSFEESFNEASREMAAPFVVMPDARDLSKEFETIWSYEELREQLENQKLPGDSPEALRPVMIVFGTGWGIAPSFFHHVDRVLKPLKRQGGDYNHLSVRAAAAIVMDRVFGNR